MFVHECDVIIHFHAALPPSSHDEHKLVRVLEAQVRAAVCEAQVSLVHLGGHEIGYFILIQSGLQVGTVFCGDFGPKWLQGDDKIA